jgi:hypothetical protein
MRRRTAGLLAAALIIGVVDSHVDWETVDGQGLFNINGARFDINGWARERMPNLGLRCDELTVPEAQGVVGQEVLRVVAQHSPPDSAQPRWHQARQAGPWLVVELSFQRLSPVVAVLQHRAGQWQLHPTALWSGSTEPWTPAPRIRDHLTRHAPNAPADLIACFVPLQDFRSPALLQPPKAPPTAPSLAAG